MKKLLSILFTLISFAALSQVLAPKSGGVALRVNDSTAYISSQTSAHGLGYADIFWNNQATTPHMDIWNGSAYVHVFDFNAGGGGGGAVSSVFTRTGAVTAQSGDYTVAQVTGAAPLASPTFTGTVTVPTPFTLGATSVTSTGTQLNYLNAATGTTGTASTNLVYSASPALTGTPTAPTPSAADNSTKIATTAYVDASVVNPMTTQGDIIVGGASGALSRMGIGSPYNLMRVNSGATSPQYFGLTTGSNAFWSATGLTEDNANNFWDDTNNRLGIGTNAPSSRLEVRTDALGITQVTTSGLALVNTTAAANLAAQISPSLRFTSNGWGTTAGTSQEVTTEIYSLSVQSTVPTGSLVFRRRIAGAAAVEYGTISTAGIVAFPNFNASSGVATNDWNRLNQAVMNISPSNGHSGVGIRFQYVSNGANTQTSGNQFYADFAAPFLPTSGTATWSPIAITGQVSMSGGANGAVNFYSVTSSITAGGDCGYGLYNPSSLTVAGNNFGTRIVPASCRSSFGLLTPTAKVHIGASTTAANTGQIKLDDGVDPTAAENGLINRVGSNLHFTADGVVYTAAKTLTATETLNFDLTAVNYQDLTITITGAADGDAVSIGVPNGAVVADVTYFGWVSATNTVSIRCSRVGGGGAADPASGTFRASVIKY